MIENSFSYFRNVVRGASSSLTLENQLIDTNQKLLLLCSFTFVGQNL